MGGSVVLVVVVVEGAATVGAWGVCLLLALSFEKNGQALISAPESTLGCPFGGTVVVAALSLFAPRGTNVIKGHGPFCPSSISAA